jgi:hypothetical protein
LEYKITLMNKNYVLSTLILISSFIISSHKLFGQVSVTPATGGMALCVGSSTYSTLGNIVITEGANNDFVNDNTSRTFILTAPTNFQFNPGTGSVSIPGANDFSGSPGIAVTATTITLTYTINANTKTDAITISGIQVKAITTPAFGYILRTGGSATQNGNAIANNQNHGTLFSLSPPNVSIADDDADDISCTSFSDNITFTGYGASSYQFFIDGSPVAGSPLSKHWTSTAGSPHSVYVVGTASNGCTAQSSPISITVNQTPTINWVPIDQSFALTDPNSTLNFNGSFSQSPGGGTFTFSGPGVSPSGGNYVFSPPGAGTGSHFITVDYTQGGCSVSDNTTFTVATANSITGLNSNYCIYDFGNNISIVPPGTKTVAAFQYYNWSSGLYTTIPNYVSGNSYFMSPNYFTGVSNAYYYGTYGYLEFRVLYTDATTSNAVSTYVYPRPTVILTAPSQLCNNGTPITLSLYPYDNGLAQTFVTGTGVSETSPGSGVWTLDPSVGGTGARSITYNYKDNFGAGCTNSDVASVTVNPPPTASITTVFDPVGYCQFTSASFPLSGNPGGGTFSGPGTFFNTFYPYYNTTIGPNTITYTYTDVNGCSDNVTKNINIFTDPSISIRMNGGDTSLCLPLAGNGTYKFEAKRQGPATGAVWQAYDGSIYTTGGTAGTFGAASPNPGFNEATNYTNTAYQASTEYSYIQVYTTGQPASCPAAYAYGTAYMISKPVITITNLPKDRYCTAEPNISLSGKADYRYFDYNSYSMRSDVGFVTNFSPVPGPDAALVGSVFQPSSASPGPHQIRYSFTDINGCSNFNDTIITINENPIANFAVDSGRCATKFTYFNSSSSYIPPSTTVQYDWDFGDGTSLGDTSHLANPKYKYPFPGGYPVSLTLSTNQGCSHTKALTGVNLLTIQSIPVSDFDYHFQCFGDNTILDTLSVVQPGAFKSRTWIFADNSSNPFDSIYQTASNVATSYVFSKPANYKVTVVDSTTLGCTDRKKKNLFILPYLTPTATTPYAINFKDSTGNWGQNGIASTWVHDIPDPTNKPLMNYGGAGIIDSVWVTNAATTYYNSGEKSHLHSPCFNFSQLDKPMVSLRLWTATQDQIAGAVLNSSVDNGLTWNTVGKLGDGVKWYNTIGIAGSPGNISTNDGWSGIDTMWRQAKIGLPAYANFNPLQKVRFKITFGSPTDTSIARSEGIAIDSFWVGNKNKVLLLEHFTNTNKNANLPATNNTTPAIYAADTTINGLRDLRKKDIAPIYYHTSFPAADVFNDFYDVGPSSRVLHYSVSSAPRTVLDGTYYNGNIYKGGTPDARIDIKDIDARSLETAIFRLDMTTSITPGIVSVNTKMTYTALPAFNNAVILYTVVTEDDSSGTIKFGSIARQMLPDAAGNYINASWLQNDNQSFTNTWNHGLPATAKLGVVTFIQDANSKEIYQAAYLRGSGNYGGAVATGVEPTTTEEFDVRMFPNPATDEVFFIYGKALRAASNWEVYDNTGRKVESGICSAGKEGFSINTSNYSGGIYFIKLINENGAVDHKELVVIH